MQQAFEALDSCSTVLSIPQPEVQRPQHASTSAIIAKACSQLDAAFVTARANNMATILTTRSTQQLRREWLGG
jgi:hypothetical protein